MYYKALFSITTAASLALGPLALGILGGDTSAAADQQRNPVAVAMQPGVPPHNVIPRLANPDPIEWQRRMQAYHMRLVTNSPFQPQPSLSDFADPGSLQVRDLPIDEAPDARVLLRQKSWTIAGIPYFENQIVPAPLGVLRNAAPLAEQRLEVPAETQANDLPPQVPDQAEQQLPTLAAKEAAEQERPQQPESDQRPAPQHGFFPALPSFGDTVTHGSGVGVSVTRGPDGTTVVEERYAGDAAKPAGTTQRIHASRSADSQPGAGISVTYDPVNGTQVQRWGSAAEK